MTNPLHLLLLVCSVGAFVLAAWQSSAPTWPRIVSVGLLLLAASFISW